MIIGYASADVNASMTAMEPFGDPVRGSLVFERDTPAAAWSQAAALMALGARLTGESAVADDVDDAELGVPRVAPLRTPFTRRDAEQATARFNPPIDSGGGTATLAVAEGAGLRSALWRTARTADGVTAQIAAATLLYTGLASPLEATRVASATQITDLAGQPDVAVRRALEEGLRSDEPTVAEMAAAGLARIEPRHPGLIGREPQPPTRGPAPTGSVIAHGTWSRLKGTWWRPGGDLFTFLKAGPSPDLYANDDYYRWTSAYDEASRIAAAQDLVRWMKLHSMAGLDTVYAHSHGGNVLLEAAALGVDIRLLVLLSTPARSRPKAQWTKIGQHARRIISLRVHCDLVVLADRSRQKFPGEYVRSIPALPGVYFDHSALTSPSVWKKHKLADEVVYERKQAGP
jgi:hypothetical protein